ncbi:MAG TPA: T9SS type A sorting domain-containing protein, partial [Phnomibacter sp.]|nr:T9SS type A sorting domain-containing protein [Phnomibacter sp.]
AIYFLGGGMLNINSSPSVTNCIFTGNIAFSEGGAMANITSSPSIAHCTFYGNTAFSGGALFNSSSSPWLLNCSFQGNVGSHQGGGMINMFSHPAVINCSFSNNISNSGGGIRNVSSSPTVVNCSFSGNTGGAIINHRSSTFSPLSDPYISNCIIWENIGGEIVNTMGNAPSVTYSIVKGGYSGTGNLNVDPGFADRTNGDLRLQPCSPAINAGDPATTSAQAGTADLAGNPRFFSDGRIDMGAYEYQGNLPALPQITGQPLAEQALCLNGTPTQLSVSATGDGLMYQWMYSLVNSNEDGGLIADANSATYTPPADLDGTLYYFVIVKNSCFQQVRSEVARVTVYPIPGQPSITPPGSTSICSGQSVELVSSSANGNQWYKGGAPIADASGQSYLATEAGSYTLTVSQHGCVSPASDAVTVSLIAAPAVNTHPVGQSITYGANSSYTVTATGATAYQWQYLGMEGGAEWSDIANSGMYSGANTATLTVTRPEVAISGYQYRCIVSGDCDLSVPSNAATLTVGKKALTITANNLVKIYDGLPFAGGNGVNYDGFVEGEGPSVLNGTLVYSGSSQGAIDVAVYDIIPGGLGSDNYDIGFVKGTLTIQPQVVEPENGETFYTGSNFFWTSSSNSGNANIILAATLKGYQGDIRTARVSFGIRAAGTTQWTPISGAQNLPVGLVSAGDLTRGAASANVQISIGNNTAQIFNIAVIVNGNFSANDPATDGLINISRPTPGGLITGGGKLCNDLSDGMIKGAAGKKTQFTFFVQYNKSMKNVQGRAEFTVKSYQRPDGTTGTELNTYKIRSNAISALGIPSPKAQFTSKANVLQVLADGTELNLEGNCNLVMDVLDGDISSPLTADKLSVAVYSSRGGIWFTNNWNGGKPIPVDICQGDLSVSGSGSSGTATRSMVTVGGADHLLRLEAVAYPNPTTHRFVLQLLSNAPEPIHVRVYSATGRLVEMKNNLMPGTFFIGESYPKGMYLAEIMQGSKKQSLKLIKQ